VVAGLRHRFEEAMKRGPDARGDLAEVGVRHNEDARNRGRHGTKLRKLEPVPQGN
jgi:hypothetical protein